MDNISPLALYVHWPWCKAKCPYCDFNSRVPLGSTDHELWAASYLSEMKHFSGLTPNMPVSSIFFGGGTPSTMAPDTVAAIIEAADELWGFAPEPEITLEANPTSIEADRFADFANAGINRVSVGVQSFDDKYLKFLGREHSAAQAKAALEIAAGIFPRVNFDLIYALPYLSTGQGPSQWEDELGGAINFANALGINHMSLYQLSIEPGTAFFRDSIPAASEDHGVAMFETTQHMMAGAGMPAYEISNHAKPGFESKHNMTYWQGGQYVGIGPGAHGRIGRIGRDKKRAAYYQIADPARWLERVKENSHGTAKEKNISIEQAIEERVMTGLRTARGIERKSFEQDFVGTLESNINTAAIDELMELGLIEIDEKGIRATASGKIKLNALIERLVK